MTETLPVPEVQPVNIGITVDHHLPDFNYPSMSLEDNGGFFHAAEKFRSDGVTGQRFDIRWYSCQPSQNGEVNQAYIERSKKTIDIGRRAGLESNVILSSPPDWAVKLARENPTEFLGAYKTYVDQVFSVLAADGGHPPAAIQIFNELNTAFTPREILPHLESCMHIVREKSDEYFHTQIPLIATITVSEPLTLKTVPHMLPESAGDFIKHHPSLLRGFNQIKLDYYPGIWHIPKETLSLYLKNWRYFLDSFRMKNNANQFSEVPKPLMMLARSFGNMDLLEQTLQQLVEFQREGIQIGISEIGMPTFSGFEHSALKNDHERLQKLGVSVIMWKLRPLISKYGIADIGLYSAIDDLSQQHEPGSFGTNWGMLDQEGQPKPLADYLKQLIDRVKTPYSPLRWNGKTGQWE